MEVKRAQAKAELGSPSGPAAAAAAVAGGVASGTAGSSGEAAPRMDAQSGTRKVFAGGLHYSTDDVSLREHFGQFGEVASAQVMYSRETLKSRGFGFVVFTSAQAVDRVMRSAMHEVDGKMVEVKRAVPKGGRGASEQPQGGAAQQQTGASGGHTPPTAPGRAGRKAIKRSNEQQSSRRPAQRNGPAVPAAVPSSTTSWAAVLAAGGGGGGSDSNGIHGRSTAGSGMGISGAESVTASVVSSVFDEAVEGVGGGMHPDDASSMYEFGRGGDTTLPSLPVHTSDVWGLEGGGALPSTPAADSASVHSYDGGGGGGGGSVMSSASFHQNRQRADSQASFRSDGGMGGASGGVGAPPASQQGSTHPAHQQPQGMPMGNPWGGAGTPMHMQQVPGMGMMQAQGPSLGSQWAAPSQWLPPQPSVHMPLPGGGQFHSAAPAKAWGGHTTQAPWGAHMPAGQGGYGGIGGGVPAGYQVPTFGGTASVLGIPGWHAVDSMPPPSLPAELSPGRTQDQQ